MHQVHKVRVLSAVPHEYVSSLYPETLNRDCFACECKEQTLSRFSTLFSILLNVFKLRSERRERPVDTSRTLERAPDTESILSQSPTLEGQGVGPLISSSGRQMGRQSVVNQSHLFARPLWFRQHNTEIPRVSLSKNSGLFFPPTAKLSLLNIRRYLGNMTAAAITDSAWQKVVISAATFNFTGLRLQIIVADESSNQQGKSTLSVCHLAPVNILNCTLKKPLFCQSNVRK